MSPQVIDSEIKVVDIPVELIYSDEQFNCRGYIPPSDVVDLAREIADKGLLSPILVQPRGDVTTKMPKGFLYRVVAGHRRFAGVSLVNKSPTIAAIIKEGLSEVQALELNLGENINRKQLNILQEARALERLRGAGQTQSEIARNLKVPRPWVQVRFYVLGFPPDIQEAVGEGFVSQSQIHELNAMETDEEKYAAVRQIKDAKIKAGTRRLKVKIEKKPKAEDLLKAEPRDEDAITTMLLHVTENGEVGLHTRALAWAAGNISTIDFLVDFKQYADGIGRSYAIPEDGLPGL